MQFKRREVGPGLALALVGLSGCLGAITDWKTDISILNKASTTLNVGIEVTRVSNNTELFDWRDLLESGESKAFNEVIGDSKVNVKIDAKQRHQLIGYETYVWSDTEDDRKRLQIDITSESIDFCPSNC